MKWFIIIIIGILSISIWARNDVDLSTFNKEMTENMQEVLGENPQIYEKKNFGRKPASIENENKIRTEQLDDFDEQGTGPNEL